MVDFCALCAYVGRYHFRKQGGYEPVLDGYVVWVVDVDCLEPARGFSYYYLMRLEF